MRRYRLSPMVLVLLGAPLVASGAEPASPCGSTAVVQRDDTLSSIASRCDISEASLLSANPDIQRSGDLQVGSTVHVDAHAGGVGSEVRSFSRRAGNAVGALANDVGSSVQDLLDKNPDLKSRLDQLGSKIGLTNDQPSATAVVLPRSGSPGTLVTITANGLPPNRPVAIGAGAPGAAYSIIGHAQSTADGTVQTKVTVPNDVSSGHEIVFSVASGREISARTGRFAVKP